MQNIPTKKVDLLYVDINIAFSQWSYHGIDLKAANRDQDRYAGSYCFDLAKGLALNKLLYGQSAMKDKLHHKQDVIVKFTMTRDDYIPTISRAEVEALK